MQAKKGGKETSYKLIQRGEKTAILREKGEGISIKNQVKNRKCNLILNRK